MKKNSALLLSVLSLCACSSDPRPINIGIYDRYDLDTWMTPIWEGRVVHNESVMLLGNSDKAELLYKPDKILAVKNYALNFDCEEGKDYIINKKGEISLPKGTRANYMHQSQYYSHNSEADVVLKGELNGEEVDLWYSEDVYTYQLNITYTHSKYWNKFIPSCYKEQFKRLIEKLENGEDVSMLFYGDSITFGASATSLQNRQPNTPIWPILFTNYLAEKYGYTVKYEKIETCGQARNADIEDAVFGNRGTIRYLNSSVGGWTFNDALSHKGPYCLDIINNYNCDFVAIAFGMNDGGNSVAKEQEYLGKILDDIYNIDNNIEVMVVAPMIPNPDVTNGWYGNQPYFEEGFIESCNALTDNGYHIAVCPMTSMSQAIYETKRFRDCTGNNINHPNDFFVRVYAQVAYQTVFGYPESDN